MLHTVENIKELRRKAGLTQAEFAAAAGVTQSTVSQWESGITFPSTTKLPKIAELAVSDAEGFAKLVEVAKAKLA